MIEPSLGGGDVGLPALFFRSADRLRLEGCVAGLLRDGRSLAISSTHEAALDHYSRILISRLRESAPQSPPELYFPADTTAMINRFNDAVSALSVQEAMQVGPAPEPARIWVVHDAGALANHEVQLLARLVQNFPGANIRVVFLLGASASSRHMFDAMDRRFLRWDIEAPTPEQAQAMLAQGREDGCEGAVRSLLKKLEAPAPGAVPEADPAGIDPLGFQAGAAAKGSAVLAGTAGDVFKFSKDAGKTAKARQKPDRPRRSIALRLRALLSWVLIFLALASLSVGVTAWLHPTVFTLDRLDMAKRWALDLTAPAASALGIRTPATLAVPADSAQPAALPVATAADAAAVSAAPAAPAELPASAAVAAPGATPAVTPAADPPAAASAAVTPDPVEVEPPSEALAGQAWVQPMPFGTWVVQHAAMPSYQAAQKWQQSVALLADARIVALYRPNDKLAYFAVVSGPFPSRVKATAFAQRKGMPSEAWVRTARSLREQFTPTAAPAAAPARSQEPRR